ncbi:hypothetical protein [Corynebacterium sp. sy039]|uniref:hypothetical protein n=1 Tax=Corynebacterium sp. sy039 TaxID=2599641 RepID=UPI00143CD574|nr:hypothetical protein [Corynebacterium sp. sy039]
MLDFARIMKRLPEHLPISDAMEAADPQQRGRYWTSQREHLVDWYKSQVTCGQGAFTRQKSNRSAKITYNRFQCAEGLVWLAEALGVEETLVQQAADAALAVPRRSRCRVVRELIGWELISRQVSSLQQRHRWWSRAKVL